MSYREFETLLALHTLKAPLDPNPTTDVDKIVNQLRLQYRTVCCEFHVNEGAVMLPKMFVTDFGDQIGSYVTFIDTNYNQFEILVERINGSVYLTTGFNAIRNFYNIRMGGWVLMVFFGLSQFGINVINRIGLFVTPPTFSLPMHFEIEKPVAPDFVYQNVPITTEILTFRHKKSNFELNTEVKLTKYDVTSGFLMIPYNSFGRLALGKKTTSVVVIDDCGNTWRCIVVYGTKPNNHIKIGGSWGRLVDERRLAIGVKIKVGVPRVGKNDTVFICIKRHNVM